MFLFCFSFILIIILIIFFLLSVSSLGCMYSDHVFVEAFMMLPQAFVVSTFKLISLLLPNPQVDFAEFYNSTLADDGTITEGFSGELVCAHKYKYMYIYIYIYIYILLFLLALFLPFRLLCTKKYNICRYRYVLYIKNKNIYIYICMFSVSSVSRSVFSFSFSASLSSSAFFSLSFSCGLLVCLF